MENMTKSIIITTAVVRKARSATIEAMKDPTMPAPRASMKAWTILASAICSLFGTIVVFFTCCSGRLHKKRNGMGAKSDYGETVPVAPVRARRRKRFGLF